MEKLTNEEKAELAKAGIAGSAVQTERTLLKMEMFMPRYKQSYGLPLDEQDKATMKKYHFIPETIAVSVLTLCFNAVINGIKEGRVLAQFDSAHAAELQQTEATLKRLDAKIFG